jgi:hypothetical protein
MRPLSRQSATEAITKNIQSFIITKTKQVTILIKNQNCFIYQLILAIVCTMVRVHQTSIPLPRVGVTLKTQQISEVIYRRTRSSYIEYRGQTTQQLFFFYHLEPPAPTMASALIRRQRLSSPTQTSQCKSYKVVLYALNPCRMTLLMRRPNARCILHTSCTYKGN